MAIRLTEQYPNRVGTPNDDYPHGVPRNKSTPTATDGTPFEQSYFRDHEGFFQGLIETSGITPSGNPDTVEKSDYLDALTQVTNGVTEIDMGGAADVSLSVYEQRIAALRLTGTLADNVDLIVPDTVRMYIIINDTSGDFNVTVKTSAGSGVIPNQNETFIVRCDGVDVLRALDSTDPSTFDNVEQMQQGPGLRIGQFVRTLGYYSPGDGGDNDYEIVAAGTGTDDGGSFIDLPASGLQARGLFPHGFRDSTQYGNGSSKALKWSEFAVTDDPNADQWEQLRNAIVALYDGDHQVLDLEGRSIGVAERIVLLAGENGFTNLPNVGRNQNNVICNGTVRWLGDNMPGKQIIEFGANYTDWPNAAFLKPVFFGLTIDSSNKDIGSVLLYNFYNSVIKDCNFLNFNNEISFYARSVDNNGRWEGDNSLTFIGTRWACLPSPAGYQGTPIMANCGDVKVEGGCSEWCGPHDYNYGSVNIVDHHWSYGNNATEMRFAAIFRDPRGIVLAINDQDNAIFKFTNIGWFDNVEVLDGSPQQLASNDFRDITISSNKFGSGLLPPSGHGIVTLETETPTTAVTSLNISGNPAGVNGQGGGAADYFKLRTVGDGAFTNIQMTYDQVEGFGVRAGDEPGDGVFPADNTLFLSPKIIGYSDGFPADARAWSLFRGDQLAYKLNYDGTIQSPATHGATTPNAANMFIGASGNIQRSTSAMKYKKVYSYDVDEIADQWLEMAPFMYQDKAEAGRDPNAKMYVGMSANQADEIGLQCMVDDTSGEVENLFYERGVALNLHLIKKLLARIEELESKI